MKGTSHTGQHGAPPSVEHFRAELLDWARQKLELANSREGRAETPYRFFGTNWFGVLQKCYWQSEELLEQVVSTLLRLPSIASQPTVARITKGSSKPQLTFAQCIRLLGEVSFSGNADVRPLIGDENTALVARVRAELAELREFAKKRNEFTHERLSLEAGNELCGESLSACVALCGSQLVSLAILVEKQLGRTQT